MYKNCFVHSCKKDYTSNIHQNRVHSTVICNIHTKTKFNRKHRLDIIVFSHIHTDTHTRIHTYIAVKLAKMSSRHLKRINMSKSQSQIFFMITTLSSHSVCSENYKSRKVPLLTKKTVNFWSLRTSFFNHKVELFWI